MGVHDRNVLCEPAAGREERVDVPFFLALTNMVGSYIHYEDRRSVSVVKNNINNTMLILALHYGHIFPK